MYQEMLRSNPGKAVESASMKQFGKGTLIYMGSNSPIISYPAENFIIDEFDDCNQENIIMLPERQSRYSMEERSGIKVSNPSYQGLYIDKEFKNSDQKEWYIECSSCGKHIHPDFLKHVLRQIDDVDWVIRDLDYDPTSGKDIQPICDKCGKPFDRFAPGEWVEFQKHFISGYRISKMFSTAVTIREVAERFAEGLVNETKMQRVYNADFGMAYTAKGAKIDEQMLLDCVKEGFRMQSGLKDGVSVMGIDVGSVLNVIIFKIINKEKMAAVYIGIDHELEDLVELWRRYRVKCAVIDGLPEGRLSKKLCRTFPGAFRWFHANEQKDRVNADDKIIHANRTQMLDEVKEFCLTKRIVLPENAPNVPEFFRQMTASTRVYNEKRECYEWVEGSEPDHYMFSTAFGILARKILVMVGK
jgi:hypothetical protein